MGAAIDRLHYLKGCPRVCNRNSKEHNFILVYSILGGLVSDAAGVDCCSALHSRPCGKLFLRESESIMFTSISLVFVTTAVLWFLDPALGIVWALANNNLLSLDTDNYTYIWAGFFFLVALWWIKAVAMPRRRL